MNRTLRYACALCVTALIFVGPLAGCGGPGNVGEVTGTVTLDGNPLAGAMVTFTPAEGGLPAAGRTDESGRYTLQYSRDAGGAKIGEHRVTITTYSEGDPDAESPVPSSPEKVPAKYNVDSELTATVKPGGNQIDFPLESGGKIIQPDPEAGAQEL